MKKLTTILLCVICLSVSNAQTPTDISKSIAVVSQFGNEISQWCRDKKLGDIKNEDSHWYKLTALTSGSSNCIVNDNLVKRFRIDGVNDGNIDIENYITGVLDDQVINGITFRMSNVKKFEGDAPKPKKGGPPPALIQADIEFNGSLNMKMTNVFWVRNGRITKIESDTSKMSLAQKAYAKRNYETAFKLFREVAYEKFTNYEAQYYTALMEIYKDGCKGIMNDDVRDYEAYIWIIHILTYSTDSEMTEKAAYILLTYSMNAKPDNTAGLIASNKPMESNRLLIYDKSKDRYGFKNQYGKIVIPCMYKLALPFNDGRAAVITESGIKCYIDENGNSVTSAYDGMSMKYYMGRSFVLVKNTVYLIDKFDKRLIILQDKYTKIESGFSKYAFLYRTDGLIDVYNFSGKEIISKATRIVRDQKTKKIIIYESSGKKTYCDFEW